MRSATEMGQWYEFWGSKENFRNEVAARSKLGVKLRVSADPKDRDIYADMIQGRFGPHEAQHRLAAMAADANASKAANDRPVEVL